MFDKYNEYAFIFKALSDPNRLLIINYLSEGERCACVILEKLRITQSTLSYHMKTLTQSNLVYARRDGKWMHYSLNYNKLKEINDFLNIYSKEIADKISNCSCNI